ncbi:CPBP family glutamic-type intramembrane protease [Halomonas sp. RA08-2]|uniref:CPBP family glutamic-type intramembrane protease n=1 Tax=Halomonas sp. RA08-2 TaxID=3440842 RepID=UPI003EEC9790
MTGWNLSVAYFLGSTLARASAGPMEELGWRGFAVPLLQRRLHPWTVILVVTGLHSLWHAPCS